MFDADQPIQTSQEDRLDRAHFAQYLARCILDHPDPDSLVIGLQGGEGVGKTSIVNLMMEELKAAASNMLDTEKPIILNFSAWSYSGQNQLLYSFFRRLSSALRQVDYLEQADRIIHLLELYVSFFTHQPIPRPLRAKRSLLDKLFRRHDIHGWESGRDLTLVKAELNALLSQQKHKIIIVIDNISRLYNYEMKQIFQIVKSIGDYAHTAYLLVFDKDQVIHSLNQLDHCNSTELVEKIIQLPFDIPPISPQDIESILTDRLAAVMAMVPEDAWNQDYWADLYYHALKDLFKSGRDITRYVNTLHFSYLRLRDMVNPVDFFALTAIEIFLPDVYSGIRDNKDLFTDLLDQVYPVDDNELKKEKSRCDYILSHGEQRDVTLTLLIHLFPRLRRLYQPNTPFYHSVAIARKNKRLCSPDMFDLYFRLSMQTGQIPLSECHHLLSKLTDEAAFSQVLTRLNQDGRIIKFLHLLDTSILQQIALDRIPIMITALLDNGDFFPEGETTRLSINTSTRIHRIIRRLLCRFKKRDDRFLILQQAITTISKSIYTTVHELTEQGREHLEETDTFLPIEYRDLTSEQLHSLRQLTACRIQHWADMGRLIEHPRLLPLLHAWLDWGSATDCKNYIAHITTTDRGLLAFLTALLDQPIYQAMTQYEKHADWAHDLDEIELFIPAKQLEPHAKLLFEDAYFEKLREREQLALMIFLDLMKAQTNKIIPKTTV